MEGPEMATGDYPSRFPEYGAGEYVLRVTSREVVNIGFHLGDRLAAAAKRECVDRGYLARQLLRAGLEARERTGPGDE